MKLGTLIKAAAVAAFGLTAAPAFAEDLSLGSNSCLTGAACIGESEVRPAAYFLKGGLTLEELDALNELIEITEETDIDPFTLVRVS